MLVINNFLKFIEKFFFKFLILVFSFLGFFILYKSEIQFHGYERIYFSKYLLILLLFIFISYFIDKFIYNKKIKQNIILFVCSSFFSLYFLEFLLISKENYEKKKYLKILKPGWSINKYLKENSLNLPAIAPYDLSDINNNKSKFFIFSNISKKKLLLCEEANGLISFDTDRYGFNNHDILWDKKKIFIFLGDSFTQGFCVNSNKNFISLFDYKNKINLGQQGTGPLVQYAILREYIKKIDSKFVLWFFYEGNDFRDLEVEKNNNFLFNYLVNKEFNQNLINKQNLVNDVNYKKINEINKKTSFSNSDNDFINNFKFKSFIRLTFLRSYLKDLISENEIYQNLILDTKKLLESNNSNLIIIYIPSFERYLNNNNFLLNLKYKNLLKFYKKNNIKYYDLKKDIFDKEDDVFKFFPNGNKGHFNEKGHQIIADYLNKNLLINLKNN